MKLRKDREHSHYWIQEEHLFESYNTLRGLRCRYIMDVIGYPDTDRCSQEVIDSIEQQHRSKHE